MTALVHYTPEAEISKNFFCADRGPSLLDGLLRPGYPDRTMFHHLLICVLLAVSTTIAANPPLTEASGICRVGDSLYIVSDDVPGGYFVYTIPDPSARIIPIDTAQLTFRTLPGAESAIDLEAIDILADGRIAVVSERSASLLAPGDSCRGDYRMITAFGKKMTELGNRGVEGLAAMALPDGSTRVAALWEGGFPVTSFLPDSAQPLLDGVWMAPRLVVYDLPPCGGDGWLTEALSYVELQVPLPEVSGRDRYPQRLRGSDLVWYTWTADDGNEETGLIAVLGSENGPPVFDPGAKEYRHQWLLRFSIGGQPVGQRVDLRAELLYSLRTLDPDFFSELPSHVAEHTQRVFDELKRNQYSANFEGMGWYIEGESVIVIYDRYPLDPPIAFVIPIPDFWR